MKTLRIASVAVLAIYSHGGFASVDPTAPVITAVYTTYSAAGVATNLNITGSRLCSNNACSVKPVVKLAGVQQIVTGGSPTGVGVKLGVIPDGDYVLNFAVGKSSVDYNLTIRSSVLDGGSVSVSVGTTTTGAAGTNAAVTNSGTASAAVLNFTIPRGEHGLPGTQGPTGPAGAVGATGPMGPPGADGASGPMGPAGTNGGPGPVGPMGPAGADGANGPMGPTGPMGPPGSDGAPGATGPAGADGAPGPTGPQGAQGPPGGVGFRIVDANNQLIGYWISPQEQILIFVDGEPRPFVGSVDLNGFRFGQLYFADTTCSSTPYWPGVSQNKTFYDDFVGMGEIAYAIDSSQPTELIFPRSYLEYSSSSAAPPSCLRASYASSVRMSRVKAIIDLSTFTKPFRLIR